MNISKEFKVGLLAVTSITILYFGFNFLKGIDMFQKTDTYYALYHNIDGLTASNPVIINGMNVGRVGDIRILQDKNNLVLVELNINSDISVSKGTVALLMNTDFLGSKAIELILDEQQTALHNDGDTLKSSMDEGIAEILKQNAGPVADNLGTTISRINAILENFQGNSEQINNSLRNIELMSGNLNSNLPVMETKLYTLLDNLNKNSAELSSLLTGLKPVMENVGQLTDSLKNLEFAQTLDKAQIMLGNLNDNMVSIKEGQGTLGKLMTDDSLYVYLSNTARDLDRLLVDVQENPGRYVQVSVFGKKDKSK
ncbi:MAG: MCE family protein [Cyclobacteriaceae bacterium]|nr:MCE family protein [Cyclobacteriaceae bacterium]